VSALRPEGWSIPLRNSLTRRPRLLGCNAVDLGSAVALWGMFALSIKAFVAGAVGAGLTWAVLLYFQHEDERGLEVGMRALSQPDRFDV
jgi:hypothetical protein